MDISGMYCISAQSEPDNPTFPRIKKWLISALMYMSRENLKFQSAREHQIPNESGVPLTY